MTGMKDYNFYYSMINNLGGRCIAGIEYIAAESLQEAKAEAKLKLKHWDSWTDRQRKLEWVEEVK